MLQYYPLQAFFDFHKDKTGGLNSHMIALLGGMNNRELIIAGRERNAGPNVVLNLPPGLILSTDMLTRHFHSIVQLDLDIIYDYKEIYTDGSGIAGGIGVYWGKDHPLNISSRILYSKQTNNSAELKAIYYALCQIEPGTFHKIITDSDYGFLGVTKWLPIWKSCSWHKQDGTELENKELWQMIDEEFQIKQEWTVFEKCPAHTDKEKRKREGI